MTTFTMTADRAEALRAVRERQVYERGGHYYRYTPRDSIDVTTIVGMFEGMNPPLVMRDQDRFFSLTYAGLKALAEYDATTSRQP